MSCKECGSTSAKHFRGCPVDNRDPLQGDPDARPARAPQENEYGEQEAQEALSTRSAETQEERPVSSFTAAPLVRNVPEVDSYQRVVAADAALIAPREPKVCGHSWGPNDEAFGVCLTCGAESAALVASREPLDANKPLPCPLCGGPAYAIRAINGTQMFNVGCSTCGLELKAVWYRDEDKPTKDILGLWNTRPQVAESAALVAGLRQELERAVGSAHYWEASADRHDKRAEAAEAEVAGLRQDLQETKDTLARVEALPLVCPECGASWK